MRARTVLLLGTSLVLALSACGVRPGGSAAPVASGAGASPGAVAQSPRTPAEPSPSTAPVPSPSATGGPAKPPGSGVNSAAALSCGRTVPLTKPIATGTGPGGSAMSTGTTGLSLTFDDGPDPINTPKLLDMLKQCGVKATFCVVGFRARDRPELIKRIYDEGHTLCNHSWQHLFDLAKRTDEYILGDLRKTNNEIHKIVPGAPISYFRAPGGNFTSRLVGLAASLGMRSIYWKIDTRDWESSRYGTGSSMVNHIVSVVKAQSRPGAIILAHDNGKPDTITAFRTLLPWLKARFILIALPTTTTVSP